MKRNLTKASRLLVLLTARRDGALEGLSLQQIAAAFGVNASTICRDLQDLEELPRASAAVFARLLRIHEEDDNE